jgi:hypothetical protein
MTEGTHKIILQIAILISIVVLAYIKVLDKDAIILLFGTIVGYAFAISKEAYIKK